MKNILKTLFIILLFLCAIPIYLFLGIIATFIYIMLLGLILLLITDTVFMKKNKPKMALSYLFYILFLIITILVWFKFNMAGVFVCVIIFFILQFYSSHKTVVNILEKGEWKIAKIVAKEKMSVRDIDGYRSACNYNYYFRVELEDGTNLERKATRDSYTDRLHVRQEIKILVYEENFLFEQSVKEQMKNIFLKKYTERFKDDFKNKK